jgi:hypothetical protein
MIAREAGRRLRGAEGGTVCTFQCTLNWKPVPKGCGLLDLEMWLEHQLEQLSLADTPDLHLKKVVAAGALPVKPQDPPTEEIEEGVIVHRALRRRKWLHISPRALQSRLTTRSIALFSRLPHCGVLAREPCEHRSDASPRSLSLSSCETEIPPCPRSIRL